MIPKPASAPRTGASTLDGALLVAAALAPTDHRLFEHEPDPDGAGPALTPPAPTRGAIP